MPLARALILLLALALSLSLVLAAPPYAGAGGYAMHQLTQGWSLVSENTIDTTPSAMTVEVWTEPTDNQGILWFFRDSRFWLRKKLTGSIDLDADGPAFSIATVDQAPLNTPPGHAVHSALVVTDNTADDPAFYSLFINGELFTSGNWTTGFSHTGEFFPGWTSSGSIARNFRAPMDEFRVWHTTRTQEEIKANMDKVLDPSQHPELVSYYRFTDGLFSNGVLHGTAPDEAQRDSSGFGTLSVQPIGSSAVVNATFQESQLEVTPGYGLPTYTGLSVVADPGEYFDFPLLGGDSDGDELLFVLDAVPEQLEMYAGSVDSPGSRLAVNSTFPLNANAAVVARVAPSLELSATTTVQVEYHCVEYFTVVTGQESLRTVAYMDLTPADSGSAFPFVAAAVAGSVLLLGLVGYAVAKNRSTEASADSEKRMTSTTSASTGSEVSGVSLDSGASASSTVDKAIAMIIQELSLEQLNNYVAYMIQEGVGQPALSLALAVEQAAIGESAEVYLAAVENVGAAMAATGTTAGMEDIKTARRTTRALTQGSARVQEGQLTGKAVNNMRKVMRKKARKTRVADAGGKDLWNPEQARATATNLQPISNFFDATSVNRVSLTSAMAPML